MLENPYFVAPSSLPDDPGVYRGEGRIEEAEDGRSISVWWESTLNETLAAQMRLQQRLGVMKQIRRFQAVFLIIALFLLLVAFVVWGQDNQFALYMLIASVTLVVLTLLRPFFFRRVIRKLVIRMRGTIGTVEIKATVEPGGAHASWTDLEVIYLWRGVQEVEVFEHGVTILRATDGLIHVPTRAFPSQEVFEKFAALAQKYSQAQYI